MARREWSDNEKATALAALDANGGNVAKTARELGIPRTTLTEWEAGRVTEDVTILRQGKKLDLAERLEVIANQLLDAFPSKLADASLKDTATAFGIAVDKRQLLLEKPTAITQQSMSEDERKRRLVELLHGGRGAAAVGDPAPGTASRVGRSSAGVNAERAAN